MLGVVTLSPDAFARHTLTRRALTRRALVQWLVLDLRRRNASGESVGRECRAKGVGGESVVRKASAEKRRPNASGEKAASGERVGRQGRALGSRTGVRSHLRELQPSNAHLRPTHTPDARLCC